MSIRDVDITITRQIARITRQGFGKALLFSPYDDVDYTECTSLTDLVAAGFDVTTDIYAMANAMLRQNPAPSEFACFGVDVGTDIVNADAFLENAAGDGGVTVTAATAQALAGTAGNGVVIDFKDEGEAGAAVAYNSETEILTINFGGAATITCTALVALIAALTEFDATTLTGAATFTLVDDLESTATMAGGYDNIKDGIGVVLSELTETSNDWYFLLSDARDFDEADALAAFAGGNKKIYFASLDASVSGHIQRAKKWITNRAVLIYHNEAGGEDEPWADAAWVGKCSPYNPGSITWKFKTLDGVPTATVTTTQITNLHAAFCNTYISKLGVPQTSDGTTTIGEYIDITRGADWIEARMSERIHYLLFTMPKVPFDNRGIGLIKGEIEAVLQWATQRGIIAVDTDGNGMFEVTVPDRFDTDPVDRANRLLKDVTFSFDLAGAIHKVRIHGEIKI